MIHDDFFYNGICHVSAPEPIINIIKARLCMYRLDQYITFENDTLYIQNNTSDMFTCRELLFDLLLFLNKHADITFPNALRMVKQPPSEKKGANNDLVPPSLDNDVTNTRDEPYVYSVFKHQRTLYLYTFHKGTGEELISPLMHEFLFLKKRGFRFIYLCDYTLDLTMKKRILVNNISVPLFEPFMKQGITLKETKYIPKQNNLILEDKTRRNVCFACVHRTRNIANGGCSSCSPVVRKKT